jgi:hypothetical protein
VCALLGLLVPSLRINKASSLSLAEFEAMLEGLVAI